MSKPHYIVVAAAVWDKGEILVVQKPKTKYEYTSFHWEYPGGKVETGETDEQALVRELHEEMNYPIRVLAPLAEVDHEYPDFRISMRLYLCEPIDTEHPRDFELREHASYRWMEPSLLYSLDWCEADKYMRPLPEVAEALPGTDFQHTVWRALCAIPRGETRTYAQVADAIGRPRAYRAVAQACHANPLPYFIPCHRVVGTHNLGGFALGLDRKKALLASENVATVHGAFPPGQPNNKSTN